jgi:YidC/Oxa1 family membrane protein insertase
MEQNRVWLAVFLSLGLFFTYDYFVMRPYREAAQLEHSTSTQPEPPEVRPMDVPAATQPPDSPREGSPIVVDTDLFHVTIDSLGGRLREFQLKRYKATVDEHSPDLDLVSLHNGVVLPLTLEIKGKGSDSDTQYVSDKTSLSLRDGETGGIQLEGALSDGSRIRKIFSFDGSSYLFELSVEQLGTPPHGAVGVVLPPITADSATAEEEEKAMLFSGGKLIERPIAEIRGKTSQQQNTLWAGYSSRYFVSLIVGEREFETVTTGPLKNVPVIRVDEVAIDGAARYRVLMGPKDPEMLRAAGDHLDRAIDFGWFWFIAIPLLRLLRLFDSVFGNYGVAIILLTVLVKVATIPLTKVQYRSMQQMKQIQPHLERLRERYKDDANGMQREMMELYRKHGVNPFSGCVPMLLQIPIFVGLYNALLNAIELRHAPFVGWIDDLSAPDRLMIAGVGIPVLVILMGVSMLAQQWMTPAQGDPTQRRMMMFMPVVFTAMFLSFPSGLVLYWLVNNVISIVQQYAVVGGATGGARA